MRLIVQYMGLTAGEIQRKRSRIDPHRSREGKKTTENTEQSWGGTLSTDERTNACETGIPKEEKGRKKQQPQRQSPGGRNGFKI